MKLEITEIFHKERQTTVYLKGCPLRCPWCQNPAAQKPKKELLYLQECCIGCMECFPICPTDAHSITDGQHTIDRQRCVGCMICAGVCPSGSLLPSSKTLHINSILSQCDGLLCISGGEPCVQHESLIQLLKDAKSKGIATQVETTGVFYPSQIPELVEHNKQFVFRIMDTDAQRLWANAKVKLEPILSNLRKIDDLGGRIALRCLMIPEVNMDETHAEGLIKLYQSLCHADGIELMPYSGVHNNVRVLLGQPRANYQAPTSAQMEAFAKVLKDQEIPVSIVPNEP